jgi:hypothetical protein
MAANIDPIFPRQPVVGFASLVSPTALTSRATITGTTGLTEIVFADTTYDDGRQVDRIEIIAKETTVAGLVWIWVYDGTKSYLFDEFKVDAVTPGNTALGWRTSKDYTTLILPPGHKLYCSVTVDQDFNVFAWAGDY